MNEAVSTQNLCEKPTRNSLDIWMSKLASKRYPVSTELDPKNALPEISRKVDILYWERGLKDVLRAWIINGDSPYGDLVKELERSFRSEERESAQVTVPTATHASSVESVNVEEDDLSSSTLPLICRLHEQDALPAILFNYDRHECEKVCRSVFENLQEAEQQQVKSGPAWARKLERFDDWKKVQEKINDCYFVWFI